MKVGEDMVLVLEHYNRGLSLYKMKKFSDAIQEFEKALSIRPEDGPSKLYLDRCKNFLKNPPPEDWDGVYTMTTK